MTDTPASVSSAHGVTLSVTEGTLITLSMAGDGLVVGDTVVVLIGPASRATTGTLTMNTVTVQDGGTLSVYGASRGNTMTVDRGAALVNGVLFLQTITVNIGGVGR